MHNIPPRHKHLRCLVIINEFYFRARQIHAASIPSCYISLPTHACMQWIRAPPTLACRPVRWLKLSGKRRMVILYELTVFEDSRQICDLRDPYGAAILKLVPGHVRLPLLGHVGIAQSQ